MEMENRTYVDRYGVKITIDWSHAKRLTEDERRRKRESFDRLAQEIRAKYARRAAMMQAAGGA